MLNRLKRPGYWIIFAVLIITYFYHKSKEEERLRHILAQKKIEESYMRYGDSVLNDLKNKTFFSIQDRFGKSAKKSLNLEDIAIFVDTLEITKDSSSKWRYIEDKNGTLILKGELIENDRNLTYPVRMIAIKENNETLLKALRIGKYILTMPKKDSIFDKNATEGDIRILEE